MTAITLDHANQIIAAAFKKGRELGMNPLAAAVVDAGGHLIAYQRQDGSPSIRFAIAFGKASGAVAFGASSRTIAEIAKDWPAIIAPLSAATGGGFLPAAGGVIIVDDGGRTLGAVGVTGDTADNDEFCAVTGIAAAGFSAAS